MNLHLSKRRLAAVGLAAAVLAGGGASIAAAAGGTSPSTASDEQQTDGETQDGQDGGPGSEQEVQDPAFTGTVAAPAETEQADGQEGSAGDAQEKAALEALTSVSQRDAEAAAVSAVPGGTVTETDLGNENGWVVYSVEVTGTDGTVTEVTVDAGNGTVLAHQAQGAEDPADAADAPESAGDQQD